MITTLATVEAHYQGHSVFFFLLWAVTIGHDEALCECQEGALWPPDGSGQNVEGSQESQRLSSRGWTQGIPGELHWAHK